jgi:hypothetical protein
MLMPTRSVAPVVVPITTPAVFDAGTVNGMPTVVSVTPNWNFLTTGTEP